MRLELGHGVIVEKPSAEVVTKALGNLSFPNNKFAVLQRRYFYFLQAHIADDDGHFVVEVQDGSLSRHYEAPWAVSADQAVDVFLSYLHDDERWRTALEWRRVPVPAPRHDMWSESWIASVTDATYAAHLESGLPLLLAFKAGSDAVTWDAMTRSLAAVAAARHGRLIVATVDREQGSEVWREWGVVDTGPPILTLLADGQLERVLRGLRLSARLLEEVDEVFGLD